MTAFTQTDDCFTLWNQTPLSVYSSVSVLVLRPHAALLGFWDTDRAFKII